MTIEQKVIETIAKQLNKSADEISLEKDIVKDLGADSLDVVEMLMNLEEAYSVTIPDEEAIKIKTVGDIVKALDGIVK